MSHILTFMFRLAYSLLMYLMAPVILGRLLYRSIKQPSYRRNVAQRLGFIPTQPGKHPTFWCHAVSLGEVTAAIPLIQRMQQQHPEIHWVVSTTTPTGSAKAQLALGDSVVHTFSPYDFPSSVKRFLKRCQPDLFILMETELWPNLIHHCACQNVPVFLANGRLSAKSARGYNRISKVTRKMLNQITMISAQYQQDALRFIALGVNPQQVMVGGNLKFNQVIPVHTKKISQKLQKICGKGRPIWVSASTKKGEEPIVIEAFKQVLAYAPNTILLLAPRHPERFAEVAKYLENDNLSYQTYQQCQQKISDDTQCILIDEMGILMSCFDVADVAFVGGSLVNEGGQNILEPAAMECSIVTGPSMYNFASIYDILHRAGACVTVHHAQELADAVIRLLEHPEQAMKMAHIAKDIYQDGQLALDHHCDWIERQYFGKQDDEPVSRRANQ